MIFHLRMASLKRGCSSSHRSLVVALEPLALTLEIAGMRLSLKHLKIPLADKFGLFWIIFRIIASIYPFSSSKNPHRCDILLIYPHSITLFTTFRKISGASRAWALLLYSAPSYFFPVFLCCFQLCPCICWTYPLFPGCERRALRTFMNIEHSSELMIKKYLSKFQN